MAKADSDPETAQQLERLRSLYKQVGEDPEVGERAIAGILASGPGAAARLATTANAVAALHGIDEGAN